MRLIIIAGVVLGLLVVAPLFAATFEDGYRAFQEGDEDDAIEIWNEPGRKGDVQSQFALGFAYFHGTGTRVHSAKTFHWFKQAGEQGHASAQYYVGLMLERGQGTAQNFFRAAEWYDLAIRWGDRRDAKCALGLLYLRGRGLPRNEAKATKLIHAAAEQGHYLAQHLMGTFTENGWGVERDLMEAFKWYHLASCDGEVLTDGKNNYRVGNIVAQLIEKITPFELSVGERRINAWLAAHPRGQAGEKGIAGRRLSA